MILMEGKLLDIALSQGIWAVVAVFLLVYIAKSIEKRDEKQEKREENYQALINELVSKFSILDNIQADIEQVKAYFQKIKAP